MKKSVYLAVAALAVSAVQAEPVLSSNTFAITEVATSTTNTIISIPWMGYTRDNSPTLDIRADRLVSPRNLTAGDMLLVCASEADETYKAWTLQAASGGSSGAMEWVPIATVSKGTTVNELVANDGAGTVVRGRGIWLIRQNPVKNGAAAPFYLNGQWTDVEKTVTVGAGTAAAPLCTMLANPDVSRAVAVNDLSWTDVDPADTLIVPTDANTSLYCMWNEKEKAWCYPKTASTMKFGRKVTTTTYPTDITVPAGTGFWYVSRGGTPTVTWPSTSPQSGE